MNAENENRSENKPADNEGSQSAEGLRAEIEATREKMGYTIDAIQERFDPHRIKKQLKDKAQEATIGRVQELSHTAGERLTPAKETVEEAVGKVSEIVKPAVRAAKKKGVAAYKFVRGNPILAAGAGAALSAVCVAGWVVKKSLKI